MNSIFKMAILLFLFSCGSQQEDKDSKEKFKVKDIDLLESFKIDKMDSFQLIRTWKLFIHNLNTIKSKSIDTVECWSADDFQKRDYSISKSVPIDSCLILYLLPLQKTEIWPLLNKKDFTVEIHKRQSESIGRYCISFPLDKNTDSRDHLFKHYFYFKKTGNKFLFQGYVYN